MDYNSWINEIIEKTDIIQIIGSYINLRKSGSSYSACCPFHSEASPSFFVVPKKQYFHCFGCGKAGNVINFVQEYERLTFNEAAKKLSERAGINIPNFNYTKENNSLNTQRYYQITKSAASFYRNNLLNNTNNDAYKYLIKRGFSNETIKAFGLGYSNDKYSLIKYLKNQGYTNKDIIEAGLGEEDFYKRSINDPFAERLIIPIITKDKNVVGFGSRVLYKYLEDKGKYKNTKETTLFKKSSIIFGLNMVHKAYFSGDKPINKIDYIYLVEGYMDVMAMHQAGIKNVIAAMGTAFTLAQVRAISRYTDTVYICFDGDKAGKKATDRSLEEFSKENMVVKIIRIPNNKDPDEYIKEFGVEAFEKLKEKALTPVDYLIDSASKKYDLNTGDGRNNFIKESIFILANKENIFSPTAYFENIRKFVSVHENELYNLYYNVKRSIAKNNINKNIQSEKKDDDIVEIQENNLLYFYCLFKNDKLYYKEDDGSISSITAQSIYPLEFTDPTKDEKELQNFYDQIKNSVIEFDSILTFSENEKKSKDLFDKLQGCKYANEIDWPVKYRLKALDDYAHNTIYKILKEKLSKVTKEFLKLDSSEYSLQVQLNEEILRIKKEIKNLNFKKIPWDKVVEEINNV